MEVFELLVVKVENRLVEGCQQLQSVGDEDRPDDTPIRWIAIATDEIPLLQPIQQSRHVRLAREHPLSDLPRREPCITRRPQDAQYVVLLGGKLMGFDEFRELRHQIVGGFLDLEEDSLLERSTWFG